MFRDSGSRWLSWPHRIHPALLNERPKTILSVATAQMSSPATSAKVTAELQGRGADCPETSWSNKLSTWVSEKVGNLSQCVAAIHGENVLQWISWDIHDILSTPHFTWMFRIVSKGKGSLIKKDQNRQHAHKDPPKWSNMSIDLSIWLGNQWCQYRMALPSSKCFMPSFHAISCNNVRNRLGFNVALPKTWGSLRRLNTFDILKPRLIQTKSKHIHMISSLKPWPIPILVQSAISLIWYEGRDLSAATAM